MRAFQPPRPQINLTEDDIRRLCRGAFERADALQRGGHVTAPAASGDKLTAAVRGVWRRMHEVTIVGSGARLAPSCDRDGATFCQHVGAVLLHWLRAPGSFSTFSIADDLDDDDWDDEFGGDDWDVWDELAALTEPAKEQPADPSRGRTEEMATLLEIHTVPELREIAKRRGIRASGNKKVDIVRQLAAALSEPSNVDAALAVLSEDDRLLLDTIDLLSISGPASARSIPDAARMLGLPVDIKIPDRLMELTGRALLASVTGMGYGHGAYVVPSAVSTRLRTIEGLLPESTAARDDLKESRSQLDLMELLLVIVHDIERLALESGIERVFITSLMNDAAGMFQYAPAGFRVHPDEDVTPEQVYSRVSQGQRPSVRLAPIPPILREDVLISIASRTGQSREAVALAGEMVLTMQIPISGGQTSTRDERLRQLLELPGDTRAAIFASEWYTLHGSAETRLLFSEDGPLRLIWQPRLGVPRQPLLDPLVSAIRLIAHIIGRLPADVPFDVPALTRQVIRLAPSAASPLAQFGGIQESARETVISIVEDGVERPLTLSDRADWERFVRTLVETVLAGPLRWLGFVDTGPAGNETPQWFRVRPTAGVLAGRDVPPFDTVTPEPIRIADDLSVFVPSGTTDSTVHALLARIGELVEGSADGLRYRLTAAGARDFFDSGVTVEQIVDGLERRSGASLPPPARETIDRWWSGFGGIRLYDELTLIELSEDVLLHELRAATSLESAILHAFSPRVIAVESSAVERLIGELTTRGYAPRVIEDS